MRRIHFIGVGGAGMSAVAFLLARAGNEVTGSDAVEGPYLRALAHVGLKVVAHHDAERVEGVDAVVVSSAVRETNVELIAARAAGIPVWHRSEALIQATQGLRVVAVAGAHGKTTTSAMAAHALHASGIDATFAIGAPVLGVEGAVGGAYSGTATVAVIEADESDGSFLRYSPEVAIVTNVEPDHLDHYGTAEAVEAAFVEFASRAQQLIACADDVGSSALAADARARGIPVTTYGKTAGSDIAVTQTHLEYEGDAYALAIPQPGWHNRLNAAAAWAAAVAMGANPERAAESLATFGGTGRRFEFRGRADDVDVYDDYAHHPTEITALVSAAKERASGRLVVLFQPHLYSRTRLLARDFATALAIPDADVVIAGIYGARELPEPGVSAATIGDLVVPPPGSTLAVVEDLGEAASEAAKLAVPGGMVVTVGAGSVTDAADVILAQLSKRATDRE